MKPNFLFLAFLLALPALAMRAAGDEGFPEAGKTYTLNRFGNTSAYLYEQGTLLFAGPAATTQKQYWNFIPTGHEGCFYIQNRTSKKYVQSTAVTLNDQIRTGAEPVEFRILKNETNNTPKGYYALCSTDQAIDASIDGTLGLNFQSTGKVVAYYIAWTRGNSYWDIRETEYDYVAPLPVESTPLAKRLGIYNLPCGAAGPAYLRSCTVTGEGVTGTLDYHAAAAPADYYLMVRTDTICLEPGGAFTLDYEAAGMDDTYAVTAYFDWNADGVFETSHSFMNARSGRLELAVPDTVRAGKVRLRIRLNNTDFDEAEDEVYGHTYDFMMHIGLHETPVGIAAPAAAAPQSAGRAYSLEGRPVNPDTHRGVVIQKGCKQLR